MTTLAGTLVPPPLRMISQHRYLLDDEPVPSVTKAIEVGVAKPALNWWYANTVAEYVADHLDDEVRQLALVGRDDLVHHLARVPNSTRNAAAAKGTLVHDLGERVVHGQEVTAEDIPAGVDADKTLAYVRSYAAWLDRFTVVPVFTECIVAHRRHRYAGKFDLIARLGTETWLLDLKTSKGVYGEVSLQCAAYAKAQFAVTPEGQTIDMPRIDRIGVVHCTTESTQLYDLGDQAPAFEEFLGALTVLNGMERRAHLIGRPVRVEDVR